MLTVYLISLLLQDISVPFGFGMVGERLCLSKARSNFEGEEKKAILYKIPARPCAGRPLTACTLLSRFSGRRKAQQYRMCTAFVVVLYRYRWGIIGKQYVSRACFSLP